MQARSVQALHTGLQDSACTHLSLRSFSAGTSGDRLKSEAAAKAAAQAAAGLDSAEQEASAQVI